MSNIHPAKQFIVDRSEKFMEAHEYGYPLTMNEEEILYWMEEYRMACLQTQTICPNCEAYGVVPHFPMFGVGPVQEFVCPVCDGKKIVLK